MRRRDFLKVCAAAAGLLSVPAEQPKAATWQKAVQASIAWIELKPGEVYRIERGYTYEAVVAATTKPAKST